MLSGLLAVIGFFSILAGWLLMIILTNVKVFSWIIIGIGVFLIAGVFVFDFRRIAAVLKNERGKYGMGAIIGTFLFFSIIIVINAASVNFSKRLDLTGTSQFTLTAQTKDFLKALDKKVEILVFFSPRVPFILQNYTIGLLNEYQKHSKLITIRQIDPDVHPDEARKYDIGQTGSTYGTLLFKTENGIKAILGAEIASGAEHAVTGAIVEVTGLVKKRIYFLTGHGEESIRNQYKLAADVLEANMFHVEGLDLNNRTIPNDASVVIMAGPRDISSEREISLIREYLSTGGSFLLLLNPNPPLKITEFLKTWFLYIPEGIVEDPVSYAVPSKSSIIIPKERNIFQLNEVNFSGSAAVIPLANIPNTIEISPVVWTTREALISNDDAYGEGKADSLEFTEMMKPPYALGALLSLRDENGGMKFAVIGDTDFAANNSLFSGNNGEFFLGLIQWLSAGQEVLTIDKKVFVSRKLILSPEQTRFINYSAVGLVPFILIIISIYIIWKKR
jgi:hypothetical protein